MQVKRGFPANISEPTLKQRRTSQASVLVAGGAGFIGSRLCRVLLDQSQVFCLDNLATGQRQNIEEFFDHENFVFIEHDLKRKLPADFPKTDYIFHVAGLTGYFMDESMTLETLLVNSLGTEHLLKLAKKHQAKFLLTSSFRVYEGTISKATLENYFGKSKLAESRFSHREAKRFSENLCFEYFKKEDLDTRIVRIADVYGPEMPLDSEEELALIFKSLKNQEPLKIKGSGEMVVYPTFIDDLIKGMLKAMFTAGSKGKIFTLVNPEKMTLGEAVHKIEEITEQDYPGSSIKVEFIPQELPSSFQVGESEILKTQRELGWQAKINFEKGVKTTLTWLTKGLLQLHQAAPDATSGRRAPTNVGVAMQAYEADSSKRRRWDYQRKPLASVLGEASSKEKVSKETRPIKGAGVEKKPRKLPKPPSLPVGRVLTRLKQRFKGALTKPTEPAMQQQKKPTFKQHFLFFLLPLFFLLVTLSPFLLFTGHTFLGTRKLKAGYQDFQKGKIENVALRSFHARFHFQKARTILLNFAFLLQPISKSGVARVDELLLLGENMAAVLEQTSQAAESGAQLFDLVLQKKTGIPQEMISTLRLNLEAAQEYLSLVQAQLESNLKPLFTLKTFSIGEELLKLLQTIPEKKKELEELKELSLLLPELLGVAQKKSYLLVFQNNHELRPTGGFIGSYGLLIFDKGKLLDFQVQDVYVADGQLKGHVEPPEELKKYLGEANWYLRDANWDPDWSKTAPRLAWFLEKEMKRRVDGVVGLNLVVTQEILKVIGSVALPDYQETITAENLFERAEYYAEIDFFPGSTQKKDFLGELAGQMMLELQDLEKEKLLALGNTLKQLLKEKQLSLYFSHKNLSALVRKNFWDGTLRRIDYSQSEKGLQDFLMLIEANVGVNKVNFFLDRQINHKLKLNENLRVEAETLITYQNNSPGESWPGGIYKNYLRAYLPKSATKIKVFLKKEGGEFLPLDASKIKEERIEDKKVVGFYFEVAVKETLAVKLVYQLGEFALKNNQGILAFYFQKQPGIVDDPLTFQIDYPAYLQPLKTEPEISLTPQSLVFETDQREDRLFMVHFYKK